MKRVRRESCSGGWIGLPLIFILSLMASGWLLSFLMATHMKRSVEEEIRYLQAHYLAEGYVSCLLTGVQSGLALESFAGQEWSDGEYTLSIGKSDSLPVVEAGRRSWKLLVWEKRYQLSVVYVLVLETKDGKTRFVRLERG